MEYFRICLMILIVICVFGWGTADSIFDFARPDHDGFLEYAQNDLRSLLYNLFSASWLVFRVLNILLFANALKRFWSVLREALDPSSEANKGSFYVHLLLVTVYVVALLLKTAIFAIWAFTGLWMSRIWLWIFMFARVVNLANFIFYMIVAKEMYLYYQE